MRLILRALGATTLAVAVTGCWPVPGQNADRTARNPFETTITPQTVAGLRQRWRADVGATDPQVSPVVSPAGVHVTGGCELTTLDPATGATRWTASLSITFSCTATQPVAVDTPDGPRTVSSGTYFTSPNGPSTQGWLFDPAGQRLAEIGFGGAQTVRGRLVAFVHDGRAPAFPATWVVIDEAGASPRRVRAFVVDLDGTPAVTLGESELFASGSGPMTTEPGGDGTRGQAVRAYSATEATPGCNVDWLPEFRRDVECPLWLTPTDGQPTAAVIGEGGATLYVGSAGGTLYALDATTGAVRWTARLGSAVGTPALADGTVYVQAARRRLVAFAAGGCGAPTCTPIWEATAAGGTTQPAVAGGVVVTTSSNGVVEAFDAAGCGAPACRSLWTDRTGIDGLSAPVVSGGQIYAAGGGTLLAYGGG